MSYTVFQLTQLLKDANVKGRSAARTREDKLTLCQKYDLCKILKEKEADEERKKETLPELPLDIIRQVIGFMVCDNVREIRSGKHRVDLVPKVYKMFRTLAAMSTVCKDFRDILPDTDESWANLLDAFASQSRDHMREAIVALDHVKANQISGRRALELVVATGCECCECPRTRKVYWPFFKRWCRTCLESKTMSDHRLKTDYMIPAAMLNELPYVTAVLFSPYFGQYELKFYLKESMIEIFRETTNQVVTTLEEIKQIGLEKQRKINEELLVIKKNKDREIEALVSSFHITIHSFKKMQRSSGTLRDIIHSGNMERIQTNILDPILISKIKEDIYQYDLRAFLNRCAKEMKNKKKNEIGDGHEYIRSSNIYDLSKLLAKNKIEEMKSIDQPVRFTKKWYLANVWDDVLPSLQEMARNIMTRKEEERIRREEDEEKEMRLSTIKSLVRTHVENEKAKEKDNALGFMCPYCNRNRRFKEEGLVQHVLAIHRYEDIVPKNL